MQRSTSGKRMLRYFFPTALVMIMAFANVPVHGCQWRSGSTRKSCGNSGCSTFPRGCGKSNRYCLAGYEGSNCNVNHDDCNPSKYPGRCANGRCSDRTNSFSCTCNAGYYGSGKDCDSAQPTCGEHQYISPASITKKQTCSKCEAGKFQPSNSSSHRLETCTTCPAGQYHDGSDNATSICTPQTMCGKGEYISPASTTEEQTCHPCPFINDNYYPFNSTTTTSSTTTPVNAQTCAAGQALCCNGKCIPARYRNDGDNDCGDNSDESNPPFSACAKRTCPTTNACSNHGTCIQGVDTYVCACNASSGWGGDNCELCNGADADARAECTLTQYTDLIVPNDNYMYQANSSHRIEQCIQQPIIYCQKGTFLKLDSTTLVECRTCPTATFNNQQKHQLDKCEQQETCSSGQYITANSTTAIQQCVDCKDNTFQPATNHRIEACTNQPECGLGEFYVAPADTTTTRGSCTLCGNGTFQSADQHQKDKCIEQSKCNLGFKISAPSITSEQTCIACSANTYIEDVVHRITQCEPQPTCSSGTYISANSTAAKQQCVECKDNTFQPATDHRLNTCISQLECGLGEFYVAPATKTTVGVCTPCTNGTYQSEVLHRNAKCIDHAKCSGNFTGSSTEAGECLSLYRTSEAQYTVPDAGADMGPTVRIAIAISASLFLVLAVGFAVVCTRARNNEKERQFDFEARLQELLQQQLAVRAEEDDNVYLPPLVPRRITELNRADLTLLEREPIGSGNFGEVWKYAFNDTVVAAKVVKINEKMFSKLLPEERIKKLEEEKKNLAREAIVMMAIGNDHPNVVKLVGIIRSGDLTVVLPFETNGDLKTFLQKNTAAKTPVKPQEKRRWVHEIANGMKHISGLHIVHRDVAARNVMVSQRRITKVADFGLARVMKTKRARARDETAGAEEEDYVEYYKSFETAVPVKWTAPEGLFSGRFSTASDVWSYAIVVVELWRNGGKPYPDLNNTSVRQNLLQNETYVHPQPIGCDSILYSLLKDCWKRNPEERPTFAQILMRLEGMHGKLKRSSMIESDHDSINLPSDAHAITIPEDGAEGPGEGNDGYERYAEDGTGYEQPIPSAAINVALERKHITLSAPKLNASPASESAAAGTAEKKKKKFKKKNKKKKTTTTTSTAAAVSAGAEAKKEKPKKKAKNAKKAAEPVSETDSDVESPFSAANNAIYGPMNPAPAAVNVVEDDSVSDDFDLDNMLDDDSDSVSDEFDLDNMLDDDSDYEC